MPPSPDPYAAHEADESALRALLYGAGGAGILWAIRRIPRTLVIEPEGREILTSVVLKARNLRLLRRSTWWRGIWGPLESRLEATLTRISRRAALEAIRQLPARLARGLSRIIGERKARSLARRLAARIQSDTEAGMLEALRQPAARPYLARIADRLGPTAKQAKLIASRAAKRRDSMTPRQLERWVRRQTRIAAEVRASVMASQAVVRVVSETKLEVWKPSGQLVYSWNPDDERSHQSHVDQMRATRADPVPAGEPWGDGAVFAGPPPYGPGACRCEIRRAGD